MNRIIIKGRLTSDPELKSTPSGVSVCVVTVAVDRAYAAKGEEKQTDFFTVETWRHTAEFVSKYFVKGQEALIEGKMLRDVYTDREGKTATKWKLVADSVEFCGSKKDKPTTPEQTEIAADDSDLPF